jgi:hypothetical protein
VVERQKRIITHLGTWRGQKKIKHFCDSGAAL